VSALKLFTRTNSRRSFNIAAYHSPHSLTWSWILSVSFDGTWRKSNGWPRFGVHPYRNNNGLQAGVVLPFVVFHWHRQPEMWFRDLFSSARDREEALERKVSKLRRELNLARATALLPPQGGVQ
jgi:hypothetical protein